VVGRRVGVELALGSGEVGGPHATVPVSVTKYNRPNSERDPRPGSLGLAFGNAIDDRLDLSATRGAAIALATWDGLPRRPPATVACS